MNAVDFHRDPAWAGRAATSAPCGAADAQDRVDLRLIWSLLRRRSGLFLTVTAATLALGLALTLARTPIYTAAALVAIEADGGRIAPAGVGGETEAQAPAEPLVETQVQIIASRAMAERVAGALGLGRDVAPKLQAALEVSRVGQSLALTIAFSDPDPARTARVVNEYARQYAGGRLSAKRDLNRSAADFLNRRLEKLRAQAQADLERVQRYRIANGLLSTSGASLTEQEISSYNQEVARARAQAAEDQAALDTARAQLGSGSNGGDVGAALGSGVVASLRSRRAEVGGLVANLSARYGPRHPDVIKARGELAEADEQIQAEIGRVVSNLEAEARASRQRLGSLDASLSGARGELARNNAAAVALSDLERRAEASRSIYENYLRTYQETDAREGTERADATVLSFADAPDRPSSPNLTLNMAFALALGLGLGLAAALIAEAGYAGLTTDDDVEKRLGTPCLGSIPELGSGSPIASVVEEPRGVFAEAFRGLRASLRLASDGRARVIAVASASPGEGKTTAAICLARSIAAAGGRVALVDCDLRRRGASRLLGRSGDKPGLVEVLRGEASPADALADDGTGVSVLAVSGEAGEDGELLGGDRMDDLIAELRATFDAVLLDTPSVLAIADARLVAAKADAVLFAVRWRHTPDRAARAALRLLPTGDGRLVGAVLTRVDAGRHGRGRRARRG